MKYKNQSSLDSSEFFLMQPWVSYIILIHVFCFPCALINVSFLSIYNALLTLNKYRGIPKFMPKPQFIRSQYSLLRHLDPYNRSGRKHPLFLMYWNPILSYHICLPSLLECLLHYCKGLKYNRTVNMVGVQWTTVKQNWPIQEVSASSLRWGKWAKNKLKIYVFLM